MELCSIEDAFPDIQTHKHVPKKALTSKGGSKDERRAARKKAKREQAVMPAEEEVTDPDRPSLKRLGEIPAFVNYSEAFQDLSGSTMSLGLKLTPPLEGTGKLPDYFGAGEDDEVEGFSNFTGADENTIANRLVPQTLDAGFDMTGVDKAGGGGPPAQNDNWKPLTKASTTTAYTAGTDPKYAMKPKPSDDALPKLRNDPPPPQEPSREAMIKKIQDLTKRLEDLERQYPRNNQRELLIFISTGVFILFSFDLAMRAGR
jgi:hypothetical protein